MSEPVALLPCPPGHVWVRWSPDAIVTAQLCDGGTCEAPAHELNLGGSHHPTSITALCLPIEATRTQTDQRGDTTAWADDMAAQMRSYYEAHKRDRWVDGTADNLMLGLLNIALRPDQQLREEVERLREMLDHLTASVEAENERGIGVSGTLMSDAREARSSLSSSSLSNG